MTDKVQSVADDICPECEGDFSDEGVAKMTDEQVALLEADVCPYCNYELQKEKI